MNILDTDCRKCSGATNIRWIQSSGMDVEPTGMKKTCGRCGFSEFVDDLEKQEEIDITK